MTDTERREAARQFYNKWVNKGREDEDDRSYWIDFLQDVMGIDHVTDRIDFQKKVVGPDGNTKRIDAYIPETRVLIEQKSLGIDLAKPQQGHNGMTPYEQAKMYDNSLPVSEKAKWIILSNFAEIWVYDMDTRVPEPKKIMLSEIPNKYSLFEFLTDSKQVKISEEMEVSVKAGEFVGLIYDALLKQYIDPTNEQSLKSLNMLCVRLVFCLYAEDAHIFHNTNGHIFHDYMEQFETKDMRRALIDLFKILDTPADKRDPYDNSMLAQFPYVNGGLFAEEDIEIPNFTGEIRDILLSKASEGFDWSKISPTIFGAVFESTLNPETRRSGGMHYTSIENIHKVIDPLFLDNLTSELNEIKVIQVSKTRTDRLRAYQDKIAALKWLDPACGSGNFLTETYLSVRRLENQVIYELAAAERGAVAGQISFGDVTNPIKVSIQQFYGIEINDFAVTVAKTALWIAESQMLKETEDIIHMSLDFLPLKTNAYIVEGNALRIDWEDVIPKNELNYIMGNPPFVGFYLQNSKQKQEVDDITHNPSLDYVSCWFVKTGQFIHGTNIHSALVSTNSITQGEQVALLWDILINELKVSIDFAYKTFIWESEANDKAHVHCVIIGFSFIGEGKLKKIYDGNTVLSANNISPYLYNGDTILVKSRRTPINDIPELILGNRPLDGQNLLLTEEECMDIINLEPASKQWIRPFLGATEFINNKKRYCLWLVGISPRQLNELPLIKQRVEKCKEARLKAKDKQMFKLAETPTLFREQKTSNHDYIVLPRVSSARRRYMPIGYIKSDVIAGDALQMITDATIYHFGVLISNIHNAWMRTTCGRMKSDYRYGKETVYNTFPWPTPTDEQKAKIEQTAQGILDARALYPDSSLADLYDPLTMPPELQKAHQANDKAVMQAYGFSVKDMSEADCVAALMKMYQELTS